MTAPQLVTYQMVLLRHTAAGRDFDEETRERIFREHLAYTLSMVAGGISSRRARSGQPGRGQDICGVGIYQKESLAEVRRLIEQDPGVQQGLYCFDVMTWRTAPGTVTPRPRPGRAADRSGRPQARQQLSGREPWPR